MPPRFMHCLARSKNATPPNMLEPRLATHMIVASLIRNVQAEGDFATLLAKGDTIAGAILIVGLTKGANPRVFQRMPSLRGSLQWVETPKQTIDKYKHIDEYIAQKRSNDPDLWILELDVAFPQRLADVLAKSA
jgi:hypothetical protein